jgi:dTDP-4-dehydrorhamnose 3,5-epimerase
MIEKINKTKIDGYYEIILKKFIDSRGSFVKIFNHSSFKKYGLDTNFVEQYYSCSKQSVLRGMHFQLPPEDHNKFVYCISGSVMDVAVDLRLNSKTYGQYDTVILSAEKTNMVYLTKGLAHGFYTLSDTAVTVYNVTSEYNPKLDAGIKWDSIGVIWPNNSSIISERDSSFIELEKFKSPWK